ncbi:galactose oxidase [Pseudovirgaria hyperparasitica]|uniref:Galactose oxidase n=1 Tax=Pseudovirgaria hyperparasitica TaxID=470096 RepID=A0A6A6VZF7_9PEZI|nr:galactose oxidase [Pseudovirgaria hyperparasitica]KAF2755236.1 galactose oxidase [Pseudovirgaria hyperparasitica]
MARRESSKSRTSTLDSATSAPSPSQLGLRNGLNGNHINMNNNASSTSLNRMGQDVEPNSATSHTPGSVASGGPSPAMGQTAGVGSTANSTSGLSGLVCNVHRTTGREPHPLVGATTTVLGDKVYVFGGRRLSRTKPPLTSDLYELDLIKRHWTKIDAKGDIPPPRYFHSVCPLGDKKMVCYGGMSPARSPPGQSTQPQSAQEQPEVVVMSDIHIYDVPSRTWVNIQSPDSPQGRYAHCAAILPSSAVFTSNSATTSAIQHNPSSENPNQGKLGTEIDGTGGAEMIVVGGQDSGNHYIEEISIFNLRSLKWQPSNRLGKACGAYRSVVAPLTTISAEDVGSQSNERQTPERKSTSQAHGASSMLLYSNYNFLDVKLELQIRDPAGNLQEKQMEGSPSPPGLRFPNGGVINNHFVVSGTFLTSSKQEYALWALDLRNMTWSKIDAGGTIFTTGSWNRGVLWSRRNTFVVLGNRKRSLVDDYNHRRINFTNVIMVELEAFGLYENPRKTSPLSRYQSVSAPLQTADLDHNAGGRQLSAAAEDLGHLAMGLRELNDMEIITIENDRIPINSHIAARRWGPYFNTLLREGTLSVDLTAENADTATLRPSGLSTHPSRNSSITITPSIKTTYSSATTLNNSTYSETTGSPPWALPDLRSGPPAISRSRALYLPHTKLTVQALVHFLYTSALPPPSSPLCTPQILCSLLQIARPYQIDGLLEAIIERQHAVLDGRNTAAIFNAAAMAAGGGAGLDEDVELDLELHDDTSLSAAKLASANAMGTTAMAQGLARINTDLRAPGDGNRSEDELSSTSTSTSASELGSELSGPGTEREIWAGELSAVVGLQKRGLRGLMEGRRMREMRGGSASGPDATGRPGTSVDTMGLGIQAEQA